MWYYSDSGAITATFVGSAFSTANTLSQTIALSFSAPGANRWLVVALGWFSSSGFAISSVTIGGVVATQLVSSGGVFGTGLWGALVPTNATQNVVFVSTGVASSRIGIALYDLEGVGATINATGTVLATANPLVGSFSVPVGGALIGATFSESSGGTTNTWSGLTQDCDTHFSSGQFTISAAHGNYPSGNPSVSVSDTLTGLGGLTNAFAVFKP